MTSTEIKSLRESLSLTQAQFGQLFGVHPITVMRWEKSEDNQPSDYQLALMDSFKKAAEDDEVKKTIGKVLIGVGIAAALFLLLKAALKGK